MSTIVKRPPRHLVPEVVQTSAMDCGPACLQALLAGFRIRTSYGRLREACHTSVDGTSIDTLEEVAVELGLDAEQVMVPRDHILLTSARALPALLVVRLANGLTHFVVAWKAHGTAVVQVMDPATGRRWPTPQRFLDEIYIHHTRVPAAAWRAWAGSEEFLGPLSERLARLGLSRVARVGALAAATADPSWRSIARLDAAARAVSALHDRGAVRRRESSGLIDGFCAEDQAVPESWWSVAPAGYDESGEQQLRLSGAVLVRVRGRLDSGARQPAGGDRRAGEIAAALEEAPAHPLRHLWSLVRADGWLPPSLVALAAAAAAVGIVLEALLLRALLDLFNVLGTPAQRLGGLTAVAVLFLFDLGLLAFAASHSLAIGRRLEARLRVAYLEKLPALADSFFRSRPVSDMAERGHGIQRIRRVPVAGLHFLQSALEIAFTSVGMALIHPPMAAVVIAAGAIALLLPLAIKPVVDERELRVRTHLGALARCYQDAMRGLVPLRAHSAERVAQRDHDGLLGEWLRSRVSLLRWGIAADGVQIVVVLTGVAWTILDFVRSPAMTPGGALLLAYWGLYLPYRGRETIAAAKEYASERNALLRVLELLEAPVEQRQQRTPIEAPNELAPGVAIAISRVSVHAGGHVILHDIDLTVHPGEQVAIVGPSGAGKTSLVSLLLGWHEPATGTLCIDGEALSPGAAMDRLRAATAWVDPAVHLWNRTLLANLAFGNGEDAVSGVGEVLDSADLTAVLERLPNGLQTQLGEGGALVSGGEAQRVRLGRALLRPRVRLVILDEPFRGLERPRRKALLATCRGAWPDATLLCITHDLEETLAFDRVVVVDRGRIVEDGSPAALAADPATRYAALRRAAVELGQGLWSAEHWRRLVIRRGELAET